MSEKEVDKWVAWHPEKGTFADGLLLSRTEAEAERRVISSLFCRQIETSLEECQKEFDSQGYRIRPVKLQFTDEPQGEGWISVNERLPEDGQQALCYAPGFEQFTAMWRKDSAEFEPNCEWILGRDWDLEYVPVVKKREYTAAVTHWQPLPAIPGGKQ